MLHVVLKGSICLGRRAEDMVTPFVIGGVAIIELEQSTLEKLLAVKTFPICLTKFPACESFIG
jgi:hypothetical protein